MALKALSRARFAPAGGLPKPAGLRTLPRPVLASAIAIGNVVWPAVNICAPAIDVTIGIRPLGLNTAVILSDIRPPQPVNAWAFEMLVCDCVTWSECEKS